MNIDRKGDLVTITFNVSDQTIANGHLSSTGKNWVIDAAKLQVGGITAQLSVYQKNAPVTLAKAA